MSAKVISAEVTKIWLGNRGIRVGHRCRQLDGFGSGVSDVQGQQYDDDCSDYRFHVRFSGCRPAKRRRIGPTSKVATARGPHKGNRVSMRIARAAHIAATMVSAVRQASSVAWEILIFMIALFVKW
jgi:hypothetical protein